MQETSLFCRTSSNVPIAIKKLAPRETHSSGAMKLLRKEIN